MTRNNIYKYGIILALLIIFLIPSSAAAQSDGFNEPFDNTEMEGWEHSPEAVVKEGVLIIGPGNFAIRMGDFTNFKADFKVSFSGSGIVFFRYNMHEGGDYACLFFDDRVVFEKVSNGQPAEMASTEWSGFSGDWDKVTISANNGRHEVTFNGQSLLQAREEGESHPPGRLGVMLEGDTSAEFDDFNVAPITAEGEMAQQPPAEEQATAVEATSQPAAAGGIEGFLAQLAASQGNPPELSIFAVNLLLSVALGYILSRVYIHWGSALSNRRRFAANFILITITTTFIILIVRSSVALSLGLVGALSIVRFRAAIKEPEELAYLFFAIGIGIGLGDNQRVITVLAMAVVIAVIGIARLLRGREADFNLHLTVRSGNPHKVALESITGALKGNTAQCRLMRYDENKTALEASYLVEFRGQSQFDAAKKSLQALSETIEITFLDNKGIG